MSIFSLPHFLPPSFFFLPRPPPSSPLFPYTTLFRSPPAQDRLRRCSGRDQAPGLGDLVARHRVRDRRQPGQARVALRASGDRKSTRLNSSHVRISYAVFCLKKKKEKIIIRREVSECS